LEAIPFAVNCISHNSLTAEHNHNNTLSNQRSPMSSIKKTSGYIGIIGLVLILMVVIITESIADETGVNIIGRYNISIIKNKQPGDIVTKHPYDKIIRPVRLCNYAGDVRPCNLSSTDTSAIKLPAEYTDKTDIDIPVGTILNGTISDNGAVSMKIKVSCINSSGDEIIEEWTAKPLEDRLSILVKRDSQCSKTTSTNKA